MICVVCKQDVPLELMGKNKKVKSGYNNKCRACIRKASKAWRDANPDKAKAATENWAKNNKARKQAKDKARYHAKFAEIRAKQDAYRAENYAYRLEIEKRSRDKNREKNRLKRNTTRRVRDRVEDGKFFFISKKELAKIYDSSCTHCGSTENQSMDHIIPLSRGGKHSIGNITTLCMNCNKSKNTRTMTEWIKYKRKLKVA